MTSYLISRSGYFAFLACILAAFGLPYLVSGVPTRIHVLNDLIDAHKRLQNEHYYAVKRGGMCPPYKPFQCPDGGCIPIKYLCDGSPDCKSGYDENELMCTAAIRPPVEETENFLKALLQSHGNDFLAKVFGEKAKGDLQGMGGVHVVAVALSESPTVEDFGRQLNLETSDVGRIRSILKSIAEGDTEYLGGSEASDFRFYAEKLQETGFFK